MRRTDNNRPNTSWWHLGATGLLQPLSEDFLYRSPQRAERHCWRSVATPGRHGGRDDA